MVSLEVTYVQPDTTLPTAQYLREKARLAEADVLIPLLTIQLERSEENRQQHITLAQTATKDIQAKLVSQDELVSRMPAVLQPCPDPPKPSRKAPWYTLPVFAVGLTLGVWINR